MIHYAYHVKKAKFVDSKPDKFFIFFPGDWHIAKVNNDTQDQNIRVIVIKVDYKDWSVAAGALDAEKMVGGTTYYKYKGEEANPVGAGETCEIGDCHDGNAETNGGKAYEVSVSFHACWILFGKSTKNILPDEIKSVPLHPHFAKY